MEKPESDYRKGYRHGKLDGLREVRHVINKKILDLQEELENLYPQYFDRR